MQKYTAYAYFRNFLIMFLPFFLFLLLPMLLLEEMLAEDLLFFKRLSEMSWKTYIVMEVSVGSNFDVGSNIDVGWSIDVGT